MPVTVKPQPQKTGVNADKTVYAPAELLKHVASAWTVDERAARFFGASLKTNKKIGPERRPVIRSSFENSALGVIPYGNGLVDGMLRAFQQDLHVVLRPDDIWLAILTQFSFYVNCHAEELRHVFVRHEGKEEIHIGVNQATLNDVPVDMVCDTITSAMGGIYLAEDGLLDWFMPSFSTTTPNDKCVASLVVMATMKTYFEYRVSIGCGYPSVTLCGDKGDWGQLRERVARFKMMEGEPAQWAEYLDKVLEYMVLSFDSPDDQAIKDFWMRACHAAGQDGSGDVETLSGWLTAFGFWDVDGKRIGDMSAELAEIYSWRGMAPTDPSRQQPLELDDVRFPIIRRKAIPKAVVDVPMVIDDVTAKTRYNVTIIAGSVGMTNASFRLDGRPGEITMVQPCSGWWMLVDKAQPL